MVRPIVRISPEEVHIDDPDFVGAVYNNSNGRVEKPARVAEQFGPYPALVGTQYHETHRIRRAALNPFFSKASVTKLIPVMWGPINIVCDRLGEACKSKESVNLKYLFSAITLDIMTAYCFSQEPSAVLSPDFCRKEHDDLDAFVEVSLLNSHIPWVMRAIYSLPMVSTSHGQYLGSSTGIASEVYLSRIFNQKQELSRQVEAIRSGQNESYKTYIHRTIFHDLLDSGLPPKELERDRLRDEALGTVTAGSDTTAYVLRGAAYHVSANPDVNQRLYEELKAAIPDPSPESFPSLVVLEKLPYLSAVVQESLRLCNPVTHRLCRKFPDKALRYQDYVIPPGWTVSMTSMLIHGNESIYPEPYEFRPERWLNGGLEVRQLERYLVPFNRGVRVCLGLNLARAELFIILAVLFRQFKFDISQVSRARDIDLTRDFIIGATAADSPGILVGVEKAS
ncbi:benzoate 4-monooxygenase cytochrome P450 [Penicillium pulvis]|uniref:benzoate 4-monooxygenase cytochrome P450 n=1 Tax=Penicillium pulvis TaxID=1562058 RepID=UPI002548142D|nr:benzoate 4-monooxygenase cytochrome P450 [Penicillium pulvis]KAJ5798523.1 benzoate 4-monooxygenase cytochrome P450 [Penicillium pulvis]